MVVVDVSGDVSNGIGILKNKNVTAVGRYYSSSAWKRLSKKEAARISAAGIEIFVVFEDSGNPLLSEESGVHDAKIAVKQAIEVGQPKGSAIYFALEHLPNGYTDKHIGGIIKYMNGVQSVLMGKYRVGVYSNGTTCKSLLDEDLIDYAWLSASSSFHGSKEFYKSGKWSLAQREVDLNWGSMSIDINEAKAEIGSFVVSTSNMAGVAMFRAAPSGAEHDFGKIAKLIDVGSNPDTITKVQALAAQTMADIGYEYPRKSCAATLSHFLRVAGINVAVTTGAQNLADRLRFNRKWRKINVSQQRAGDVGVCASMSDDVPGADHIYLVVECLDEDLMVIADNQVQHSTHKRRASGKSTGIGKKTPTEYFLRASEFEVAATYAGSEVGVGEWPDEQTNDLPELFMDDGTSRVASDN